MLIRHRRDSFVDYGVFAVNPDNFDNVVAVESSVIKTDISGNIPATMTIMLKNGAVLKTRKFVAKNRYHSDFLIVDRAIYEQISKMLEEMKHYGKILKVSVFHDSNYDEINWHMAVCFNDVWQITDNFVSFDVEHIYWSAEKYETEHNEVTGE